MAQISFMCKRTVVSSKPVQPGKTYQLSVFDRIMEKHKIRIVLYYKNLAKKDGKEITKMLKESLAEVLSSFPMATGRLAKTPQGHWFVDCNDAGVRFVEAMVDGNVQKWLKNVDREKELELVYWEDMFHKPYYWSTFYVQLTEFKEGGLAIGLSCSHLLADPISAAMFLKAWTETTLGRAMTTPPFFHALPPRRPANTNPNHRHHHNLINHYKNLIPISPPMPQLQHVTTVALEFSHQSVTTISNTYQEGLTLTPFEALATLFWVVISNVKGSTSELIDMWICLDMRKELGLDKGFFGNCMTYNKVDFVNTLDQNKSMLHKASLAIQNAAKKMNRDSIMDLVEWLERNDHHSSSLMCGRDLICVDLENVESYNLKFDDELEKPIRASYYVEAVMGEGQLLILPSSREGLLSRMVMVTLPANEAVKLCQEALLMELSPTISLCDV